MSNSNLEIISGVLVLACLLLLYCTYYKSRSENMLKGYMAPGLYMRQGMYSDLPKAGTFSARDGYVVGHPNDTSLSYTTRSSHFEENMPTGLNDGVTRSTPADFAVKAPTGKENDLLWVPDAEIPLNVYTGNVLNSHQFSNADEDYIRNHVFNRKVNIDSVPIPASLGGTSFKLIDYGSNMQPTWSITM